MESLGPERSEGEGVTPVRASHLTEEQLGRVRLRYGVKITADSLVCLGPFYLGMTSRGVEAIRGVDGTVGTALAHTLINETKRRALKHGVSLGGKEVEIDKDVSHWLRTTVVSGENDRVILVIPLIGPTEEK